jgi:hypothetical protein
MVNKGTVYTPELLKSHKKYEIFNKVANNLSFLEVVGWKNPPNISGPYMAGREIVFYNTKDDLMCVFTYFPLHALKKEELHSDILIREIKSYVFDNVQKSNLNITECLNYDELLEYKTLTTRYSSYSKDILKIVNSFDEYRWEIVPWTDDKNKITTEQILMEKENIGENNY